MTFPGLSKSYKGRFPLSICATSFVHPAGWSENVESLAPSLDEIELLFFESAYEGALPGEGEIEEIRRLLRKNDTACNVHLPLDISLGDRDPNRRRRAVETVRRILESTEKLAPTTYTVHFTFEETDRSPAAIAAWTERLRISMGKIASEKTPPAMFSAENLEDYPFEWAMEAAEKTGVRHCLDIGHHLARGEDFEAAWQSRRDRTDVLHVYGLSKRGGHGSLADLGEERVRSLARVLDSFSGTVCVEVFSFRDLEESLEMLESLEIGRRTKTVKAVIRRCDGNDRDAMFEIVNDAAMAYKAVIPSDRWREPYMPMEELEAEIGDGVEFFGFEKDGDLVGVMGIQAKGEVALIRHAYVRTAARRKGVGAALLRRLEKTTRKPILVGTWKDASWAVSFYERNGYRLVSEDEKSRLLKKFWNIPERQVETSVVLAKPPDTSEL